MIELLTQTKQGNFKVCRRYFFLKHELHLTRRDRKPGRRRGAAFALALEHLQQAALPDALVQVGAVIKESYADVYPKDQAQADELEFEKHVIARLAVGYTEVYGPAKRREVEYNLPLINPATGRKSRTFRRAGKIDGVVHIGPKHVEIIEDKLVGQVQKAMIERLPLDSQSTEYVDAFAAMGWTADVRYRYTRWPQIKQRKNETLAEFLARFSVDVQTRPGFYFIEERIVFPKGHLEEFRHERWQLAQDIMQARRQGRWYKSTSRCWEWGGCEFIPYCCQWENAEDLYVIEPDNPELENANDDEDEG